MKKRTRNSVCVILAIVLAVAIITPAVAASVRKQITVDYGISLCFNDEPRKLVDANGNEVVPFVYQGTTYVPIRGVSYLFGADVGYDADTNTALIYDDFSEACAVVHQMGDIIADAYILLNQEMVEISLETFNSDEAYYQSIADRIDSMFDTLDTIVEDNGNATIIVNEVLPAYSDFINSFAKTYNAYDTLCKSQSSYNANQFIDNFLIAVENYYDANAAVNDFFNDYCMWRDIGF